MPSPGHAYINQHDGQYFRGCAEFMCLFIFLVFTCGSIGLGKSISMEEEYVSDTRTETACPTPASPDVDVRRPVSLRVDGRVHHTTAETLMRRSDYFKRLLLRKLGDKSSHGYLDSDPKTI